MDRNCLEKRIKEIVKSELGISEIKTSDMVPIRDLKADSLDLATIVMIVEQEFDIEFNDDIKQDLSLSEFTDLAYGLMTNRVQPEKDDIQ